MWWRVVDLKYVEANSLIEAKELANNDGYHAIGVCVATPTTPDDLIIWNELGKGPEERFLKFIPLIINLELPTDEGEGEA